jgi:hypothetical protein
MHGETVKYIPTFFTLPIWPPASGPKLSQMSQFHTIPFYFFKIPFYIMPHLSTGLSFFK